MNLIVLILSRSIRQMLAIFWREFQKSVSKLRKRKRKSLSWVHVLHKTWNFHVEVMQWLQRNVQKSVMHVQSCCFADLNLLLFCLPRWRRCRRCLSPLLFGGQWSKSLHWFSYAQMTNAKASFIEFSIYIYPDLWKVTWGNFQPIEW